MGIVLQRNVVYNNAKVADSKVAWEYVRNHGYVYNMEGNMDAGAILWENPSSSEITVADLIKLELLSYSILIK